MAKEARTAWTLNRIPAPLTYPQFEKIMQWSNPECMQTGAQCAAHGSLAWYTSALLWQWGDQIYRVPMLVLEMMAEQNSLVQRWISQSPLLYLLPLPQHNPLVFEKPRFWILWCELCFESPCVHQWNSLFELRWDCSEVWALSLQRGL